MIIHNWLFYCNFAVFIMEQPLTFLKCHYYVGKVKFSKQVVAILNSVLCGYHYFTNLYRKCTQKFVEQLLYNKAFTCDFTILLMSGCRPKIDIFWNLEISIIHFCTLYITLYSSLFILRMVQYPTKLVISSWYYPLRFI